MKIVKRINTNAAIAINGNKKEIVILGKGVGFPKVPYELTDISIIERTFYDIAPIYINVLANLSNDIVIVCTKIYELAKLKLECELNTNFPIILADHIQFAIERIRKNFDVKNPLEYELYQFYPKEIKVAKEAIKILKEELKENFPESEVASITLHIINAEKESNNIQNTMKEIKILTDIIKIVEKDLGIKFNKENFYCSRFITHARFLIQRLEKNTQTNETSNGLLPQMRREYPGVFICCMNIQRYLKKEHQWKCNDEEIMFLMLHLNRLKTKNKA